MTDDHSRKEALSNILQYVYKEYQLLSTERQRILFGYIVTHLTTAAVIISACTYVVMPSDQNANSCTQTSSEFFVFIFSFVSIVFSCLTYFLGLYALSHRRPYKHIFACIENLMVFYEKRLNDKYNPNEDAEFDFFDTQIKSISESLPGFRKIAKQIGVKLWWMSTFLMFSFIFACIGIGLHLALKVFPKEFLLDGLPVAVAMAIVTAIVVACSFVALLAKRSYDLSAKAK